MRLIQLCLTLKIIFMDACLNIIILHLNITYWFAVILVAFLIAYWIFIIVQSDRAKEQFRHKLCQQETALETSNTAPSKKSTKPCILYGFYGKAALNAYEPAFREPGVIIPLAEPKPVPFPLTKEDIAKLKAGLRYVWCDGFEATEWQPRNCKYLGIRITDSFVLHETLISPEWGHTRQWVEKCRARRITIDEVRLVLALENEISAMRVEAEDVPLPGDSRFWIQTPEDCHFVHAGRDGKLHHRNSEDSAALLLAVTND